MKQDLKVNGYLNYDEKAEIVFEEVRGVSMTDPSQDIPLPDLLERFTQGSTLPKLEGIYTFNEETNEITDELDLVDVQRMTPQEKHDLAETLRVSIAEERKKLADKQERIRKKRERQKQDRNILEHLGLMFSEKIRNFTTPEEGRESEKDGESE